MRRVLLPALSALVSAVIFLGCSGSDDDPDTSSPATPAADPPSQVTPSSETPASPVEPAGGATGPASAGDRNPDAPDNAISDRPGGPGDD